MSIVFVSGALSAVLCLVAYEASTDKAVSVKMKIYISLALWASICLFVVILLLYNLTLDLAEFTMEGKCTLCNMVNDIDLRAILYFFRSPS